MLHVNNTKYNNIFYFFKNSINNHLEDVEKPIKNENREYKINKINLKVSENENSPDVGDISGKNLYALFNLSEKAKPKNEIIENITLDKGNENNLIENNEMEKMYKRDPKYSGYSCPHFKEVTEDVVEMDKYYLNFKIVKTDKTDIYKLYLIGKNNELKKYSYARIPNIETSKMVKEVFENSNESTIIMRCELSTTFMKWIPINKVKEDVDTIEKAKVIKKKVKKILKKMKKNN